MDILKILIGGGLLAFIQWAFDKWSDYRGKKNKTVLALEQINEKLVKIQYTIDEREAVLARTHILRFNDELYNEVKHSKEYFDQTLEDIKTYNMFCKEHPKFENERTVLATENIKETYKKLHDEHKFL